MSNPWGEQLHESVEVHGLTTVEAWGAVEGSRLDELAAP
jgi:hypothetical protein